MDNIGNSESGQMVNCPFQFLSLWRQECSVWIAIGSFIRPHSQHTMTMGDQFKSVHSPLHRISWKIDTIVLRNTHWRIHLSPRNFLQNCHRRCCITYYMYKTVQPGQRLGLCFTDFGMKTVTDVFKIVQPTKFRRISCWTLGLVHFFLWNLSLYFLGFLMAIQRGLYQKSLVNNPTLMTRALVHCVFTSFSAKRVLFRLHNSIKIQRNSWITFFFFLFANLTA